MDNNIQVRKGQLKMYVMDTDTYLNIANFQLGMEGCKFTFQGINCAVASPLVSRLVCGFLVDIVTFNNVIGVSVKTPSQLRGQEFEVCHEKILSEDPRHYFVVHDPCINKVLVIDYKDNLTDCC